MSILINVFLPDISVLESIRMYVNSGAFFNFATALKEIRRLVHMYRHLTLTKIRPVEVLTLCQTDGDFDEQHGSGTHLAR